MLHRRIVECPRAISQGTTMHRLQSYDAAMGCVVEHDSRAIVVGEYDDRDSGTSILHLRSHRHLCLNSDSSHLKGSVGEKGRQRSRMMKVGPFLDEGQLLHDWAVDEQ